MDPVPFHYRNRKHIIHDVQQKLVCRNNRLSLSDGGIPVQHLLENFRISNEALTRHDQTL